MKKKTKLKKMKRRAWEPQQEKHSLVPKLDSQLASSYVSPGLELNKHETFEKFINESCESQLKGVARLPLPSPLPPFSLLPPD